MHDALVQMIHEINALRCSKSQNFENRPRKSNFIKNPQLMKNINSNFLKTHKLIN